MKKKFIIAPLLLTVIAIVPVMILQLGDSGDSMSSDQPIEQTLSASWGDQYNTVDSLVEASDLVVIGRIDRIISEQLKDVSRDERPFLLGSTDFDFAIEEVLKGNTEKNQILLHQVGMAGETTIADDPLCVVGEEYLLFLEEYESGKYFVKGGPQGRFKIQEGRIYSLNHVYKDIVHVPLGMDLNGLSKAEFIDSIGTKPNS